MPGSRYPRRLLVAVVLCIVGTLAALWIVNQIDETLSPEAAAFYESGKLPPLTEKHGFALIVGMSAPIDQDPRSFAVAWSRDTARAVSLKKPMPERIGGLKTFGADELFCFAEDFDCIERYRANPRAIDDLVADNTILLRRYWELASEPDLSDAFDTMYTEASLFDVQLMERAQAIVFSQVTAHAIRGKWEQALETLERDAALYRRWLAQARSLVCKFVAARMLRRNLMMALQLSKHVESLSPAQHDSLRRIAAPLTKSELALEAAVRIESTLIPKLLDRVISNRREMKEALGSGVLMSHVLSLTTLRNATLNVAYQPYARLAQVSFVEPYHRTAQVEAWRMERDRLSTPDWHWLYNPGGRMFVSRWVGQVNSWDSYFDRIRDTDVLTRLTCAVIDLHLNRVARQDVEAYLSKSDPRCHDPYTGKPMQWDTASGTLWFKPADPINVKLFRGKDGRVGLPVY